MQVILDSSFARPGSAPICGGKKGEFRDSTTQLQTQINILPFPGLAQSGTEQSGQAATLLGWPKSIHYIHD